MKRLSPSLLLAICFVALLGATARAQVPLVASFEVFPAEPSAGEVVQFVDTTKNPTAAHYEYAWDLDADDDFDDGTDATATKAFEAGTHRVSLRVRRIGTTIQTDTATRTIVVKEAQAPTVTPTATATASPPPAAAPANAAPVARIDKQCGPVGPTTLCLGPLAKVDKLKTFQATESTDADGQIVRYEWDLDGNGSFEVDTGAKPRAITTYRDEQPLTIRLRVTDNGGATHESAMALNKLGPACQAYVMFKRVHAASPCMRRHTIDRGEQYRSEFPVVVNGVTIVPAAGKAVLVNVLGKGLLRTFEIISGSATATFPVKGEHLRLQQGQLRWKLGNNELTNVGSLAGRKLNGLRISGAPGTLALPTRGVSRIPVFLKLPDAFGAPTSDKPLTLTAGTPNPDISGAFARAAGADDAFEFTVPNASIGPVGLNTLKVSYDGAGLWEIDADLDVPVIDARIHGKAGILNGGFNYAGVEVGFPSPGLGPLGPIFIQRVKFRVEINPKRSECVPHLGVESETFMGHTFTYDYGVPTFALCGEVGLTAGPRIMKAQAISLDAGLGLSTYADRPSVMRAYGDMRVMSIPFARATFEAHSDGFLKVTGRFDYGWEGFASVHGRISLGVLGKKFNAEGGVRACLDFVSFCRGVSALISSKGFAVCLVIDYWVDDWRPGFGYKWGDALPTPYFSGCSLGPYRETIRRASAASVQEREVTLPAGLPGSVVAATGAGAPPKITLVGPKGERITTPDDLMPVEAKPFFLMKNPQANLTQIAIMRPSGGRWKVIVEDGSAPVTSLKVAHAVEPPKITAALAGKGHKRTLRYAVEQRAGQVVSFIERGASTSGAIGTARGARGEVAFSPAGGAAEKREIVAIVEQDGMATDQVVVARYTAPGVRKPGVVRKLHTKRRKGRLTVSWRPAARAERHVVTVSLSDGRRIVRQVRGRRLVLRKVARGTRAKVSVRGISAGGVLGPTARR